MCKRSEWESQRGIYTNPEKKLAAHVFLKNSEPEDLILRKFFFKLFADAITRAVKAADCARLEKLSMCNECVYYFLMKNLRWRRFECVVMEMEGPFEIKVIVLLFFCAEEYSSVVNMYSRDLKSFMAFIKNIA